jgi:hypothetical protein
MTFWRTQIAMLIFNAWLGAAEQDMFLDKIKGKSPQKITFDDDTISGELMRLDNSQFTSEDDHRSPLLIDMTYDFRKAFLEHIPNFN